MFGALYGDVPASFPSFFPLTESVARLRARTGRSVFSSLFHESAVGPVSASRVRLQRVIPLFGNSFKPVFVGAFRHDHGRVVLEGRFTMFLFSKIFMTIWLAFALVWTMLAVGIVVARWPHVPAREGERVLAGLVPLLGIGFFVLGIAFVRGCWWLSRRDIPYLAAVIQAALSPEDPRATAPPGQADST